VISGIKTAINRIVETLGYKVVPVHASGAAPAVYPNDMEGDFRIISGKCRDFTMTSLERLYALYQSVRYITQSNVPGDLVECGVWKGGSSMLMAHTLLASGPATRKIYLYDTFAGMSKPTEKDKAAVDGGSALETWGNCRRQNHVDWCYASVEEVRKNMHATGYPQEKLVFVQGKVEDTIPKVLPDAISLLRLDTDWYESTYHELKHLFPLLSKGGVIILDDYGHWAGAKEATDTFISENNIPILLNRIDYTCRLGIKR